MDTIKNIVIIILTALLLITQCNPGDENPDNNGASATSQGGNANGMDEQSTSDIVFSGSGSGIQMLTGNFWTNYGKDMLAQQIQSGPFKVTEAGTAPSSKQYPLAGFKIDRETIDTMIFGDAGGNLPENFTALYLMPAVRSCDLEDDIKKYTIMVGPVFRVDNKEVLSVNKVADFFKPCPHDCVEIPGYTYDWDNDGTNDITLGVPNVPTDFKADTCKP